jgi:hypothetical protein
MKYKSINESIRNVGAEKEIFPPTFTSLELLPGNLHGNVQYPPPFLVRFHFGKQSARSRG